MTPVMMLFLIFFSERKKTFSIKYNINIIRNFGGGAKRQLLHLMTFGTFNL